MKVWLLILATATLIVQSYQATEQQLIKNVFTVKQNEMVSLKCPVNSLIEYNSDDQLYDYDEKFNNAKRSNKMLIVQWFKDSTRLNKLTLPQRYSLHNANNADLNIQSVRASDSGYYSCKIINGYGSVVHEFRLIVKEEGTSRIEKEENNEQQQLEMLAEEKKYSPPYFTNPEDMEIRSYMKPIGSFAQFSCDSEGVPRPDVMWFKNGEVLSEEGYGLTR